MIREEIAKSAALLALIGPDWLDARDEHGKRRLENPNDSVRIEIGAALKRGIPVIPILLEGARIPKADQLPQDLKELALRNNWLDVRRASLDQDMGQLFRALERVQPPQDTREQVRFVIRRFYEERGLFTGRGARIAGLALAGLFPILLWYGIGGPHGAEWVAAVFLAYLVLFLFTLAAISEFLFDSLLASGREKDPRRPGRARRSGRRR